WGDGTTSGGLVALKDPTKPYGAATNPFVVTGSHVYEEVGSATVRATVFDTDGGPTAGRVNVTTTGHVSVADAPLTAVGGPYPLSAIEGNALANAVVAIFRDADPGGAGTDYRATIDWGDGTTSAGAVRNGVGVFNVFGNHAYAEEGRYPVTVTVVDTDGTG